MLLPVVHLSKLRSVNTSLPLEISSHSPYDVWSAPILVFFSEAAASSRGQGERATEEHNGELA